MGSLPRGQSSRLGCARILTKIHWHVADPRPRCKSAAAARLADMVGNDKDKRHATAGCYLLREIIRDPRWFRCAARSARSMHLCSNVMQELMPPPALKKLLNGSRKADVPLLKEFLSRPIPSAVEDEIHPCFDCAAGVTLSGHAYLERRLRGGPYTMSDTCGG